MMNKMEISSSGSALTHVCRQPCVPQRFVIHSRIGPLCGWTPVPMNGWVSHHPVVIHRSILSYLPLRAGVRARWAVAHPVGLVSLGVAQIPPHVAE